MTKGIACWILVFFVTALSFPQIGPWISDGNWGEPLGRMLSSVMVFYIFYGIACLSRGKLWQAMSDEKRQQAKKDMFALSLL